MKKIHILLYYKFVNIKNPEKFSEKHLEMCKSLGILGKVLIAREGINGSVSGSKIQTERYKKVLKSIPEFSDIVFKEEIGTLHPFTKMVVKAKKEIIRLDKKVNLNKKGKYISPEDFLKLYKNNEDVIILDTRNDYESKIGRFKDVSQLEGGIINFCQKFPNSVWEGKCFVFDDRLLSNVDSESKPITECIFCNSSCDLYKNCKNVECNALVNICPKCENEKNGCCSDKCFNKYKEHLLKKAIVNRSKKNRLEVNFS